MQPSRWKQSWARTQALGSRVEPLICLWSFTKFDSALIFLLKGENFELSRHLCRG